MSNENFNKDDGVSTPEEYYFSRSKNQWLMVSDMSDTHVRRAFKRLLRMIRLNQLVEVDDVAKNTIYFTIFSKYFF